MLEYPAYVTKELAFDTFIKNGDTGTKVRRVQEWLTIHEFATPIDGSFGDATEKCDSAIWFRRFHRALISGDLDA